MTRQSLHHYSGLYPHENGFSLDHSSRDHELGCPFAVLHGNHRFKNPLEKNFEMPFMVTVQAGHD